MRQLALFFIALLCIVCEACKSPEQVAKGASLRDSSLTERTAAPQDSILFLTFTLKKDTLTNVVSAALKDMILVPGTMKKVRLGGASGNSASRILISFLNAAGSVVDSTVEDNPLEAVYEFVNEQGRFEKRYVPTTEAYLPLRIQRREALAEVRLEHYVQPEMHDSQQHGQARRTLIAHISLLK